MTQGNEIRHGDCIDEMQEFRDNHFHAVVTDPPYNFEDGFMGEEWDNIGSPKEYQDRCEAWATEALRVLKPGGHLIAFGGSRTEHRLKSGIEDAGFEIRDTITWHYSTGFPKGADIGKHIDKYGGNAHLADEISDALKAARKKRGMSKREADELFCGGTSNYSWFEGRDAGVQIPPDETFEKIASEWPELEPYYEKCVKAERDVIGTAKSGIAHGAGDHYTVGGTKEVEYEVTAPATSEAEKWEGWKPNLKPATEFAVLARKPLSELATYMNVLKHGTGALNVHGAAVEGEDMDRYPTNVAFEDGATDGIVTQDPSASRYFYTLKASPDERTINGQVENNHSTVKPLELMEWLVTLVTAEGHRVLDPFAGSGTTIMACKRLGREGVGIEMDDEYADIARKRVELAHEVETGFSGSTAASGQADLQAFADGGSE